MRSFRSRRSYTRVLGLGMIALLAVAACGESDEQVGAGETVSVSVGRQPHAAGNTPVTQYMMENDLFEKAAEKLGAQVEVEYRDYPSALPMVEAMVAGRLDIGMWGNTPIIRAIAQKQPVTPIAVGEGHLRFVLATRKDSGIKNVEDLKGKTVGVLLGGDPQNAFGQILRWTLGSADPSEFGIRLVNTPSQASAATVPKGMDATLVGYPSFLKQQAKDDNVVGIVNTFGFTEDGYQGPEGNGGGYLLPGVKDSPFYPDGFYLHRSLWVAHDSLREGNPKVITAFQMAVEEATRALSGMDPKEVSQLVEDAWDLPPADGAKVVEDEVLFVRGWSWLTEADAWGLAWTSQFMAEGGIIDEPLRWEQVTDAIARAAPAAEEAYDEMGSEPPESTFTESTETDLRGLPMWEYEQWQQPEKISD